MNDGIIKNDGTSRLLHANLPATYEELRAAAAAGTQPIDILFNALGWQQLPTYLNKANLLKDATAALFSLGALAVPDDVLAILGRYLRDDAVHLEVVSYVGTGTYGQSNACSVTFSFAPKLALMLCQKSNGQGRMIFGVHLNTVSNYDVTAMASDALGTSYPSTSGDRLGFTNRVASNSGYSYGKKSSDGKTFSWYYEDSASVMFNDSGTTYYVLGIG